jgi:hypothetical protein
MEENNMSKPIDETLVERGGNYGKFKDQGNTAQHIKNALRSQPGWRALEEYQKEALETIAMKISRILCGRADYADSWHDIAGYAELVAKELNGEGV